MAIYSKRSLGAASDWQARTGAPKTRTQDPYDGKVHWDDLSRLERVPSEDDAVVLYHHVLSHVHLRHNLRVVLVVDSRSHRQAVLFSTERDAKQFTSLSACQARSQAKLHVHFNASLSALTLGKLEARQQSGGSEAGFSMASVKRRAFNQHLLERISQHLAEGHSLEKSSPEYQDLCNYGTITDRAA